jgi:hypothetical protein
MIGKQCQLIDIEFHRLKNLVETISADASLRFTKWDKILKFAVSKLSAIDKTPKVDFPAKRERLEKLVAEIY